LSNAILDAEQDQTANFAIRELALLIPDGVGLRNFVLGPFLRQYPGCSKIHALHVFCGDNLAKYNSGIDQPVEWTRMISHRERPLPYVLRNCLATAQLYWVDTFAAREHRSRPIRGSWRTRAVRHVGRALGRCAGGPRRIAMLEGAYHALMRRSAEVRHYTRMFEQMRPSLLLSSNQRPPIILAPVLAAQQLGIPTVTCIYSWDNLSSKGRMAARFDYYLVWSDHMRRELLRFYPDISPDQVRVVGTPQFDIYADSASRRTREQFFRSFGGDPARPLICYSGGDTHIRHEPQHVRVLMDLVRSGKIRHRPQVLLRPSPVDDGSRFAEVRRDFPELIYAQPQWLNTDSSNWSEVMPSLEDIEFLANLTLHADVNVNFASTMTLDFAIHDRPVVNPMFDVTQPPIYGMPMWDYVRQLDHYQPAIELGVARFSHSADEMAEQISAYLDDPSLDSDKRKSFLELEVGVPVGQSSRRIVEVLEEIVAANSRPAE
jgi:hypothetical protein